MYFQYKYIVLSCKILVEDPRSEVKTKSKRRTKALRPTCPCVDQRYKAMWKTKIHGEDQGHEREPTMGVVQFEVHPKGNEKSVWESKSPGGTRSSMKMMQG